MLLFLVFKGVWGLRDCVIWFTDRGVFPSQCPGNFLLDSIFVEITFHKQKLTAHSLFNTRMDNHPPPPQLHHEITCFQNCTGDDVEEADQD